MLNFNLKKLSYIKGERLQVNSNLLEKLLEHAEKKPNHIAVLSSDTSWHYHKLYCEVLLWKNRIRSLNLNGPTVICLHRGPRLLAILLALQWLEIPYIPVEITTPIKRIKAIIEDSKAQAILHDTLQSEEFISLPCHVWDIHNLNSNDDCTLIPKEPIPKTNNIVYIIYTSGSTGNPKGVSIKMKALSNFLASVGQSFLVDADDTMLATTTIAFDISYLELYLPIWQGKTVFIANQNEHKDPSSIKKIIAEYPITVAQGTPSFWNMLFFSGWQGKNNLTALCGGEPISKQLINTMLPSVKALWNMYGPTEATIWCSLKKIHQATAISVGKPLHNLELLVLDSQKKLVPLGTKGELFISGTGLADGYYNHQRLTDEKFITIKLGLSNKRIYSTGDIARINEHSEVEIFGRVDNQIKLHGYRIELEDIEAHIQANLGVKECVVGIHEEQLVAYICINANGSYNEEQLKHQLVQELPEFMIPKRFVYLNSLPLNTNGKLDRKALSLPNNEILNDNNICINQNYLHATYHNIASAAAEFIQDDEVLNSETISELQETSSTTLQELIKDIWEETLKIKNIDINRSFFELGGHSLSAARIANKIQTLLNKSIKINDIYKAPTIAELTELVSFASEITPEINQPHKGISKSQWQPLTDFQFVLWVSNIFEPAVKNLNIVERKRVLGSLDIQALNLALQSLLETQEIFSYQINKIFPLQRKRPSHKPTWQEISLTHLDADAMEKYLHNSINELTLIKNWSQRKSLLVAKLFHLSNNRIEIQIAMPHLISDQYSVDIFFKHLSKYYSQIITNTKIDNFTGSKSFIEFAKNEYTNLQASINSDEKFWIKYLEDTALFNFPPQYIVPCNSKKNQDYYSIFPIDEAQIDQWKAFCIQHTVTLNDFICAGVGLTLKQIFAKELPIPDTLFINTVKSSREDPNFDEVIGCFIKSQPIKLRLNACDNLATLAKQAQLSNLETANHQHASSLIKISSIGKINSSPNRLKNLYILVITKIYSHIFKQKHNLNLPIINACKRLAKVNRKRGFLININIWQNFFNTTNNYEIFGKQCETIPDSYKDVSVINGILEICLLRDEVTNQAYLIISANLQATIREIIGKTLLETIA